MWDKWLDRCKQFVNQERENNITKKDKKKKLRKTRKNTTPQHYKDLKMNLYTSSKIITNIALEEFFFNNFNTFDLFFDIDSSGVVTSY